MERRRADRTEIFLRVEYNEPRSLITDYLTNVSTGGLFIRTEAPFSMGQRIKFSFSFPGLLQPVPLDGIVRWRREKSEEHPGVHPGVGVEFIFADEQHKTSVCGVVERVRQQAAPPQEAMPETAPLRVLLVEDNQFVHDLFRHAIMKLRGELTDPSVIELVSAFNGRDALHKLETLAIDLAIVDHFLPSMRGTELIQQIRSSDRLSSIPILVVSVGGDGVRQEAFEAGADLYLDKPVLLKQLLATLQLILSTRNRPQDPGSVPLES